MINMFKELKEIMLKGMWRYEGTLNRDYQYGDRNYNKEPNENSGVEKYNIQNEKFIRGAP